MNDKSPRPPWSNLLPTSSPSPVGRCSAPEGLLKRMTMRVFRKGEDPNEHSHRERIGGRMGELGRLKCGVGASFARAPGISLIAGAGLSGLPDRVRRYCTDRPNGSG